MFSVCFRQTVGGVIYLMSADILTPTHTCTQLSMTTDVVLQLQRISGQQSRIRDLKSKLTAFKEVLARQEQAFAEVKMATR